MLRRVRRRTTARLVVSCLLIGSLAAGACAGSDDIPDSARAQPVDLSPRATATPAPDGPSPAASDSTPEPTVDSGSTTPRFEPTPTPMPPSPGGSWAAGRSVGDCFDAATTDGGGQVAGSPVPCDGPHQYEIFLLGDSDEPPGAPYPTSLGFSQDLFAEACAPALRDFAGADAEVVPFTTTVWTPLEVDWNEGDRRFACAAGAGLPDDNPFKVGTAAAGDLVTDEGIVASAVVDGQSDLHFSFQHSTLYPLTDGRFGPLLSTPLVLVSGFLFAAPVDDADPALSQAYDFNFDSLAVTPLDTGLDGWEVESPRLVFDPPAFVMAARRSPQDDWDIYSSAAPDDVVALTDNDVEDRWPSLTPDQQAIVYHSDGDIWIMNVDGSDPRPLTSDAAGDFESAVSPDGSRVLFRSDRSGNDDIWIMDIDGSNQQNLTDHPADESWPFFSADGTKVFFQTDRLGVDSIIMVSELDGSNPSYYSREFLTNGAVLPTEITRRYAESLDPIEIVLADRRQGVVPGQQAVITHSSDELSVALPGGWEFEERTPDDDEIAVLVSAPSLAVFDASWAADGVLIRVVEADSAERFQELVERSAAANDEVCVPAPADSTDVPRAFDQPLRFDCGEVGAAVVLSRFDADRSRGVIVEGQWDSSPTPEIDAALIFAIAETLS